MISIFFLFLFDIVFGFSEECVVLPRSQINNPASLQCSRLGDLFVGVRLNGPSASSSLCNEYCDGTSQCGIGGASSLCLGTRSCTVTGQSSEFQNSLCPGASAMQYYAVALTCRPGNTTRLNCWPDSTAACWATAFQSPESQVANRYDNLARDAPVRNSASLESAAEDPENHQFTSVGPSFSTSSCVKRSSAQLSNADTKPFAPLLSCANAATAGTALPGSPPACVFDGGMLLLPDSSQWRDFRLSFNFYPNSNFNGAIGLVWRFSGAAGATGRPHRHYLATWSRNGCSGVFARRASGSYEALFSAFADPPEQATNEGPARLGIVPGKWHQITLTVRSAKSIVGERMVANLVGGELGEARPTHQLRHDQVWDTKRCADPDDGDCEVPARGRVGLWFYRAPVEIQDIVVRHLVPEGAEHCGNGECERSLGEDCVTCADDCVAPCTCGDGLCATDDEALGCPADCGTRSHDAHPLDDDRTSQYEDRKICQVAWVDPIDGKVRRPPVVDLVQATAVYWSFDRESDRLADVSGHFMDLELSEGGTQLSSSQVSSSALSSDCQPERPDSHCLLTTRSRQLVLRKSNAHLGTLPVSDCPFTVVFVARADVGGSGRVIGWGASEPAMTAHQFSIDIDFNTGLVVRYGRVQLSAPVNWAGGAWRHITFVHVGAFEGQRIYVDGTLVTSQGQPCNPEATPAFLTFGELVAGDFNGALDELRVSFLPWTQTQVTGDMDTSMGYRTAPPPTPSPTPRPPTPAPTPEPPTPAPTPNPRDNSCPLAFKCSSCLLSGCVWCSDGSSCASSEDSCVGGAANVKLLADFTCEVIESEVDEDSASSGGDTTVIIGASVGGVAVLGVLTATGFLLFRRHRRQQGGAGGSSSASSRNRISGSSRTQSSVNLNRTGSRPSLRKSKNGSRRNLFDGPTEYLNSVADSGSTIIGSTVIGGGSMSRAAAGGSVHVPGSAKKTYDVIPSGPGPAQQRNFGLESPDTFNSRSNHMVGASPSAVANSSTAPLEQSVLVRASAHTPVFTCPVCSKSYPSESDFEIHKSKRGH